MKYVVDERWKGGPLEADTNENYTDSLDRMIYIEGEPGMLKDPCAGHMDGCSCKAPLEWTPLAHGTPEYVLAKEIKRIGGKL